MGGSILCSFDLYFLFIKCKRVKLSHSHYCLLPVDSSMSLSVTECNWFCQGQSIAPRQASSAGDRGCITVNLYSGYKKWHCVFVHGCFKNRNNDLTEECNGLDTHWPSDQVKLQDPNQPIITWQTCRKCGYSASRKYSYCFTCSILLHNDIVKNVGLKFLQICWK